MPRIVDYPRKSLSQSLELANAVDALGGTSSEEMAAKRMGRKGTNSGAFSALIAASVKYGLVDYRKSLLATTTRYREYKLAYDEEQRVSALRSAFLNVPLFQKICDRFAGKPVPIDILDKLLIREFDVPEAVASRVGEYFLEGAKLSHLLSDGGVLTGEMGMPTPSPTSTPAAEPRVTVHEAPAASTHYIVRITGPGISSTVDIFGEEDLLIVDAVLARIRRSLKQVPS